MLILRLMHVQTINNYYIIWLSHVGNSIDIESQTFHPNSLFTLFNQESFATHSTSERNYIHRKNLYLLLASHFRIRLNKL